MSYRSYGFGDLVEHVDASSVGGPSSFEVRLPDNWWSMPQVEQEDWLVNSDIPPAITALVLDQQSSGAGPGGTNYIKTPIGTFRQSDLLLYGGLALAGIVLLEVVSSRR